MCEQPEKEEMIGRGEKKKKKKSGQWRRNIYHKSFFVGETNTTRVCDHLFKPRELALQFVLSVTKPTSNGPPHLCVYVMYILCPSLLFSAQFHSKQTHFSSSFFSSIAVSTFSKTLLPAVCIRPLSPVSIDRPVKGDSPPSSCIPHLFTRSAYSHRRYYVSIVITTGSSRFTKDFPIP